MVTDKQVLLQVIEAQQDDVDKGIVRIDTEVLKALNINQGEIVELEGSRKTVAIAARAFPADMGRNVIRMDPLTRRNAGTSIGEKIKIRRVEVKPAKVVTLAPVKGRLIIQGDMEGIKRSLLGRALAKGDIVSIGGGGRRRRSSFNGNTPFEELFESVLSEDFGMSFGFAGLKLVVVSTTPKESVIVTEDTAVTIKEEAVEELDSAIPEIAYEDIGGLDEEIKKVREMIELPLKHPEIFEKLGVQAPKGVLLYGPPGTGKTLLAKAVAHESHANFISINGPEIMSKFVGEAEKKMRKLFEDAEKNAPSILFIDEIDAIAPKREESYGEVERRVVAQLLASMDGLKSRGKVVVIAATNRPDSLDPALRRGGRFDREIEIGVPNTKGRLDILKIHTRNMPLAKNVNLKELSDITYGFVGADLESLAKEAAMSVLRRVLPDYSLKEEDQLPKDLFEKLIVYKDDFKEALKLVRPSAMREVMIEVTKTKWEDIGGLEKAKQELKEAIEWPLKYPQSFKNIGIKPPKGILLYGPPGTGKTLLARAVATESGANFISVKGPEVLSKWVGESEKAVRKIFAKARQVSPAIILFDEVDAIASNRSYDESSRVGSRVLNQILTELDGLEELADVVVIAATNRPELVDPALLRPGRFDRHILITPPDEKARLEIFKVHTKNMKLSTDINMDELAKKTPGYSGADIEAVVREAGIRALRENINAKEVKKAHFESALTEVKPSLAREEVERYVKAVKEAKAGRPERADYLG